MSINNKAFATVVAAISLFNVGVSAFAQGTMSDSKMSDSKMSGSMMSDHKMAMSGSKMGMHHSVYVCKDCKMYYMPMAAKKMGYKDSMGHKLVKMSSVPAGYTSGAKMMDKMSGNMTHSKM